MNPSLSKHKCLISYGTSLGVQQRNRGELKENGPHRLIGKVSENTPIVYAHMILIHSCLSWGCCEEFEGLVRCHHGGQHSNMQADMVLKK